MKNRSLLSKLFLGEKIPIDKGKLNYKQLLCYEWNKTCRVITNLIIFLIYNLLAGGTWYAVSKNNGVSGINIVDNILIGGTYTFMTVGHITLNASHWLINKFTKEKVRKDMIDNNNPIPKKSGFGIAVVILTIIPLIIWLFGKFIISIKCSKYVRKNGSLETEAMRRFWKLEEEKNKSSVITDAMAEVIKGLK